MRWTKLLSVALLVGAAPCVANGAGRAATPPAGTHQAWLAERARLGRGLPAPAKAIEEFGYYAYLEDAGDLDGDGKGDVVDVRGHLQYDDVLGIIETVRLEARRGRDGGALWTLSLPPSSYVFPVFTKVGLDGKPGALVIAYRDVDLRADVGAAGAYETTVYSVNGAGTPVWVRDLDGAWGGSIPGFGVGDTTVNGLFDAVAGGGTDLLLQTTLMAGGADPVMGAVDTGKSGAEFSVLDGATGAVRPLGAPMQSGWEAPYAEPVGDLDKDKLADVVVDSATDSGEATLTALSSADGRVLWTRPRYAAGHYRQIVSLPDVTGDGAADVGVHDIVDGFGPPGGPPGSTASSAQVLLLDGASGRQLWRKAGTRLYALGNVDGRPGAELAVGETLNGSSVGFTVGVFTATGKRLWSVTRKLKLPANADKWSYYNSWSAFADFNADGVLDIGYAVRTGSGKSERRDEGSIDGRTGRVTRDARKDMYGTRAAFDGRGADAFVATAMGGVLTIEAWKGDAPKQLWSIGVRFAGTFQYSTPLSVDGDKCGDLAVAVFRPTDSADIVFSGSTGAPLWSITRVDDKASVIAKPAVARHKVYRKGC